MFFRAVVVTVRGVFRLRLRLLAAAAIAGVAGGFGFGTTTASARFGRSEWNAFRRPRLPDELLPTMLAAKVKRLSIALRSQQR